MGLGGEHGWNARDVTASFVFCGCETIPAGLPTSIASSASV